MATPEQVRAAINALYRVRAIEKPPEADGTREIWHQATPGVELFSVLDAEGKLTQQELTLFGDVLHWSRRGGLRSGRVSEPSTPGTARGDTISFDPALTPERLRRTAEALTAYQGADKYLLNLRALIDAALQGREWSERPVISKIADSQPITMPSLDPNRQLARFAAIAIGVMLVGCLVWKLLG